MKPKGKTPVQKAQEGLNPAVEKVIDLGGRCMEQEVDRVGLVWERWLLPNGRNVILFGTPFWRDVFVSVAPGAQKWDETLAALEQAAAVKR